MTIKTCRLLIVCLLAVNAGAMADCNNAISLTTPDAAFTLHGNGTVTHNATGLMWMRCELGLAWDGFACNGTALQEYTWQGALQAADAATYAGYDDWRLPNKNELASIVEEACAFPAMNTLVFPNASGSVVWSSSPDGYGWYYAWSVTFSHGSVSVDSKDRFNLVRLVRGGQ